MDEWRYIFRWLQHFKHHIQPTKENPVPLILDGQSSHKELSMIEYEYENHIHMVCAPPHTTHKLQPLDRTFFKPFKASFASICAVWMRKNPGARITNYDVAAPVDTAFSKAARLEIAQNGFRCTGIYLLNRDIFSNFGFLLASMTDVNLEEHREGSTELETNNATRNVIELSPLLDTSKKHILTRSRRS
ncbi:MFS-type transporter clz9 [Anthophora plagiata]